MDQVPYKHFKAYLVPTEGCGVLGLQVESKRLVKEGMGGFRGVEACACAGLARGVRV